MPSDTTPTASTGQRPAVDRRMCPTPEWWPAGVTLQYVRGCNCQHCQKLLNGYAEWRQDKAGAYRTLDAFT